MIMMMVVIYVLIPLVLIGLAVGMFWMVIRDYRDKLAILDGVRKRGKISLRIDGDKAIVETEKDKEESLVTRLEKLNEAERRDMAELVRMMREDREMERMRESDRSLAEKAEALRNKNRKPQPVMSSIGRGEDRQVSTNAKVLIPYGLSELDKEILEEFYNK